MTPASDPREAIARFRAAAKKRTAAVAALSDADAALAVAMDAAHKSGAMEWSEIAEVAQVAPVGADPAATAMWRTRNLPESAEKVVHPDTNVEGWLTLSEAAEKVGLTAAQFRARLKNPLNPLHERVTPHDGWRRNRKVTFYEVAD
ncbi:MAG: hypothetical protein R2732_10320 [Microbacteriaceae bacterium]